MASEGDANAGAGMKFFIIFGLVFQIFMIIAFAACFKYGDGTGTVGGQAFTDGGVGFYYPMYQDVHVMIFVGFGFLMTFLKRYGFGSVGFNFLVAAFVIEWSLLMNGIFEKVWEGHGVHDIDITIVSLIFADFAAGAVLITFGGILGKVSPFQLLVIALLEIIVYNINEKIGVFQFKAVDMGGSMYVHTFGAYFGLACAWVLGRGKADKPMENDNNGSNKTSDTFAMIGTVFLWMFWPSFNGAMATEAQKHRVVINTVISLAACCVSSFIFSALLRPGQKFDMVDIQNASLAGGVAVGSAADLVIQPWGAALIGTLAAMLSVVGYTKITPWLEKTIGLYDTCGIHNLHGMPGVMGGLGGVFCALVADDSTYPGNMGVSTIYAARGAPEFRSAGEQAQNQLGAAVVSVILGICGGLMAGLVAKGIQKIDPVTKEFNDELYWQHGGYEVGAGYADPEKAEAMTISAEKEQKVAAVSGETDQLDL